MCKDVHSTSLQQGLGEAFKSANLKAYSQQQNLSTPVYQIKKKFPSLIQVFNYDLYVNYLYKVLTL